MAGKVIWQQTPVPLSFTARGTPFLGRAPGAASKPFRFLSLGCAAVCTFVKVTAAGLDLHNTDY